MGEEKIYNPYGIFLSDDGRMVLDELRAKFPSAYVEGNPQATQEAAAKASVVRHIELRIKEWERNGHAARKRNRK